MQTNKIKNKIETLYNIRKNIEYFIKRFTRFQCMPHLNHMHNYSRINILKYRYIWANNIKMSFVSAEYILKHIHYRLSGFKAS